MKYCFANWTKLRQFFSKNNLRTRGFSLVETLIAAAIILTNLGVISSAVVQYGVVSRKQRIMTKAMDLEAAIHGAVSDPANYTFPVNTVTTIDDMITNYQFPDPFKLQINVENTATNIVATMTNLVPTFSVYLNDKLDPCGGTFADSACVLRMEISRASLTVPASGTPTFAFAYRISFNPANHIKVLNLGANHDDLFGDASQRPPPVNPTTGKNDYNLYVPQFLLLANTQSDCVAGTAGLTGFDRRTGLAQCLLAPTALEECGANQIAKGLTTALSGTRFQLRPICVTTRQFTCGLANSNASNEDYSMYLFDPASIDPDYYNPVGAPLPPAAVNRCVISSATSSIFAATYTTSINVSEVQFSNVCPPRYNINNDCTLVSVTTPNGFCTYCPGNNRDIYGNCNVATNNMIWASGPYTPVGSLISNNSGSPGTDSIRCYKPLDNTDLSGIPECNPPLVEVSGVNRPIRRATIQYQASCAFDNSISETIDAGAL